jgi:hypothetical protein
MPMLADHLKKHIRINYPFITYMPSAGTPAWVVTA